MVRPSDACHPRQVRGTCQRKHPSCPHPLQLVVRPRPDDAPKAVRLLAAPQLVVAHQLADVPRLVKPAANQRINNAPSRRLAAMIAVVSVPKTVRQLHQTSLRKSPRSFQSKSDPITVSSKLVCPRISPASLRQPESLNLSRFRA